jgi:hypothetical protein
MMIARNFLSKAELPVNASGTAAEQPVDFLNQPADIDYRMTSKYARQSICQIAIEAFARTLREV